MVGEFSVRGVDRVDVHETVNGKATTSSLTIAAAKSAGLVG
jgi:hypothetical protein